MKILLTHIILLLTSITLTARSLTCKRLYYDNAGFFDGGMNSKPTDQSNTLLSQLQSCIQYGNGLQFLG